jgi:hypothetical protein
MKPNSRAKFKVAAVPRRRSIRRSKFSGPLRRCQTSRQLSRAWTSSLNYGKEAF